MEHPRECVQLLVGQLGEDDLRAMKDKENHYGTSSDDWKRKRYFLSYHQVDAHMRYLEENPDEVVHFKRFQKWYRQQVAAGHAPGSTLGDNGFWAEKTM